MELFNSILQMQRIFLERCIKPGDIVIDATAGNGYDTCFVSELTGKTGKVYAFDIQMSAVEKTRDYLIAHNALGNTIIFNESHEYMFNFIPRDENVQVVLFNLGYLPGGDKTITTLPETTKKALLGSLERIIPGGHIFIAAYPGHTAGRLEKEELFGITEKLDQKQYNVMICSPHNQKNNPPVLICIEKRNK